MKNSFFYYLFFTSHSLLPIFKTSIIAFVVCLFKVVPVQAAQPKLTASNNQVSSFSAIQVFQPILVGGIAVITLSALGLGTAMLSSKNKEQSEVQIKSAKEIADAAKVARVNSNRSEFIGSDQQKASDEVLKSAVADLIKNYHTQALTQSSTQFWFSITAASVGFVLILYTSFISLTGKMSLALLNTIPGVAMEAVAALFFKQAEDTRTRATQLYDRLRADEKEMEALTLIETIENKELRDLVKAKWALQIVGLQSQPVDLSTYLPK